MSFPPSPCIVFTPSGKRGSIPAQGTTVLQCARHLGVDIDSVCGGRGICGKCQIVAVSGDFPKHGMTVRPDALSPWNGVEQRYKDKRGLAPGRRLGCQARIQGDVVVDVPPESQVHKQVIRKAATDRPVTINPATRLYLVDVAQPDMDAPLGDLERLRAALDTQWGVKDPIAPLALLNRLQPILRAGDWRVTVAVHTDQSGQPRLIDVWPDYFEGPLYGFAVDLGSTTIAAHLCDLSDGSVKLSSGLMNPQIRFGEDLMSRVSYGMLNPGGSQDMTRAVRQGLDTLFTEMAGQADVPVRHVVEAVFVCNPVMHHLLLGIDPVELGQAPFALATSGSVGFDTRDLGLGGLNRAARGYLLPCIAGHVGADAAAVALSEAPDQSHDLVL